MANETVMFVQESKRGEYAIANIKSLPARSFNLLHEDDKKSIRLAVVSAATYKRLESGEILKNADLGFYSEQEVMSAVNEVELLKNNEAEYLKTIEELKKQIASSSTPATEEKTEAKNKK